MLFQFLSWVSSGSSYKIRLLRQPIYPCQKNKRSWSHHFRVELVSHIIPLCFEDAWGKFQALAHVPLSGQMSRWSSAVLLFSAGQRNQRNSPYKRWLSAIFCFQPFGKDKGSSPKVQLYFLPKKSGASGKLELSWKLAYNLFISLILSGLSHHIRGYKPGFIRV